MCELKGKHEGKLSSCSHTGCFGCSFFGIWKITGIFILPLQTFDKRIENHLNSQLYGFSIRVEMLSKNCGEKYGGL